MNGDRGEEDKDDDSSNYEEAGGEGERGWWWDGGCEWLSRLGDNWSEGLRRRLWPEGRR